MGDNKKLLFAALLRLVSGFLIIGLLLFLCAGDIRYPNAWLFLAVFAVLMLLFGTFLFIKDKELLKKRLNSKEKEKE